MANIDTRVDIIAGGGASGVMRRGFYEYGSPGYDATNIYAHFKTNIKGGYIMAMIEAKGTHYGVSRRIHARWVFYSYSVGSLIHTHFTTIGGMNGIDSGSFYLSSDNFVCFSAKLSTNTGDCNFTLNSVTPCPTGARYPIQITAHTNTASATGAY